MFIDHLKPNKRYCILHTICFIFICVIFSVPIATDFSEANAQSTSILLDAQTLTKGYTISAYQQQLKLGILPEVFSVSELMVDIKDISHEPLPLPPNKQLVSPIFLYDIQNVPQQTLSTPLMLALQHSSDDQSQKNIYFWDKHQLVWKQLPTSTDSITHYARTSIPFPFSIVAVFSEELVVTDAMKEKFSQEVQASSIVLIDTQTSTILYEKNADERRSIASLSKLMTLLVFLEHNPGWDTHMTITKNDQVSGARLKIQTGETVSVKDLFYATLIGSKNNATMALVRSTNLTQTQFTELMNEKAHELGMTQTFFAEPTGLSYLNRSTARDVTKLTITAFKHPLISEVSTNTEYVVITTNTNRAILVESTNQLLDGSYNILAGKTGFTPEAQYCLTEQLQLEQGNVIVVLLGSPEKDRHFEDMKIIFDAMIEENR